MNKAILASVLAALFLSCDAEASLAPKLFQAEQAAMLRSSSLVLLSGLKKENKAEDFTPAFYPNHMDKAAAMCEGIELDTDTAHEGYIGLRNQREKKIKAQLSKDEEKYTYTLFPDGEVSYLPLQCGNGRYMLSVLENTVDNKYRELASLELDVTLDNDFAVFLHANQIVRYDENSKCVKKAGELAGKVTSEKDFVKAVYELICSNVKYDDELAATVASGYLPSPDKTLETGKGICFDYSALAAAMFRSQGIPAKVITGYVGDDGLYHAWNAIYLQDSGWIHVGLRIDAEDWTRLDLTFEASGETEKLYVDRYVY